MEAWREGTPVLVAAGSDVMADHCADSGGGFTFVARDDFARHAADLLDDAGLRARLGEAGRRYVAAQWSWEAVTARLDQVVRGVLQGTPAAGAL